MESDDAYVLPATKYSTGVDRESERSYKEQSEESVYLVEIPFVNIHHDPRPCCHWTANGSKCCWTRLAYTVGPAVSLTQ